MAMEILGPDGQKIVKSDADLKAQESFLKAKVLAAARAHGAAAPEFRGMVKGPDGGMEPAFGDWTDGMSPEAIQLVMNAANSAQDPAAHAAHMASLGVTKQTPVAPTFTQKQEQVLEKMSEAPSKSISKSIFGF